MEESISDGILCHVFKADLYFVEKNNQLKKVCRFGKRNVNTSKHLNVALSVPLVQSRTTVFDEIKWFM